MQLTTEDPTDSQDQKTSTKTPADRSVKLTMPFPQALPTLPAASLLFASLQPPEQSSETVLSPALRQALAEVVDSPGFSFRSSTEEKLSFRIREIPFEVQRKSDGSFGQVRCSVPGFEVSFSEQFQLTECVRRLDSLASGLARLKSQHQILSGTVLVFNEEFFDVSSENGTFVVGHHDILRTVPGSTQTVEVPDSESQTDDSQMLTRVESRLTGHDRLGRPVRVQQERIGSTESRWYFDTAGNLLETTSRCLYGSPDLPDPGNTASFSVAVRVQELADGMKRRTVLSLDDGRRISAIRIGADNTPLQQYDYRVNGHDRWREIVYEKKQSFLHGGGDVLITYEEIEPGADEFHPNLRAISATVAFNLNGLPIRSYDAEKAREPGLTPDGYLDKVAGWAGGDPELIGTFLQHFIEYTLDSGDSSNPLAIGEADSNLDYWQSPEQTVLRTEHVPERGEQKVMRGDCDDSAFLAEELLERAGVAASVMLIPDHACCISLIKGDDGSFSALTLGTYGFDRNGNWRRRVDERVVTGLGRIEQRELQLGSASEEGYATALEAVNAVLDKYSVAWTGTAEGRKLEVSRESGVRLAYLGSGGRREILRMPVEALHDQILERRLREAMQARLENQSHKAVSIYNDLLNADPVQPIYLLERGLSNLAMSGPASAKADLEKAGSVAPEDPEIRYALGLCYLAEGNEKAAVEKLSEFISGSRFEVMSTMEMSLGLHGHNGVAASNFAQAQQVCEELALERVREADAESESFELAEQLCLFGGSGEKALGVRKDQAERLREAVKSADSKAAKALLPSLRRVEMRILFLERLLH